MTKQCIQELFKLEHGLTSTSFIFHLPTIFQIWNRYKHNIENYIITGKFPNLMGFSLYFVNGETNSAFFDLDL